MSGVPLSPTMACLRRRHRFGVGNVQGTTRIRQCGRSPILHEVDRVRYDCRMAQTVIVKLTDDIDGGEADETVIFALSGVNYEIDLNAKNAEKLREAFAPFIAKARTSNRGESNSRTRSRDASAREKSKTLFSSLDQAEKERFRTWAEMPTARRVSDARVNEWIDAGRP